MFIILAPGQNRTDTRSLEGYCSTFELQARKKKEITVLLEFTIYCKEIGGELNPSGNISNITRKNKKIPRKAWLKKKLFKEHEKNGPQI